MVAAQVDIVVRHLDDGGWDEGSEVEDADAADAPAVFVIVAYAGTGTAREAECGVGLKRIAAVALVTVLQASETVVISLTEGLAGLNGHSGVVCVSS